MTVEKKQIDKFIELAKSVETNEDEAAFDRALKKIAKSDAKSADKPTSSIPNGKTD